MTNPVFFDNWQDLLQIAITAPVVYVFIILSVRVFGKRSTSQMNNFDWVVTVAIGSIAASGIMLKDVSLSETLLAIALLLSFQWLLTKAVKNYAPVGRFVKATPTLLVNDGTFIEENMHDERITQGEVMAAVRESGMINLDEVQFVILETDATFSVIGRTDRGNTDPQFDDVRGYPVE